MSASPEHDTSGPAPKRRKLELDVNVASETAATPPATNASRESSTARLIRPISPPLTRRGLAKNTLTPQSLEPDDQETDAHVTEPAPALGPASDDGSTTEEEKEDVATEEGGGDVEKETETRFVASPIQLTRIRDLPSELNRDTVGLRDLLGDPMIKECWNFNFLFDVDFVLSHFDPGVRESVQLKIVHGFWKTEDIKRVTLVNAAERHPNVELIQAWMPDPFGTHHTKMMILFRHDDLAQVIIHTANMISRDWVNMTQAVWRSPLLPLHPTIPSYPKDGSISQSIGSGERFKIDILRYLGAYGKRLVNLSNQLIQYDFSAIRAAFLGSTPSRHKPKDAKPSVKTSFGWLGLKQILSTIPNNPTSSKTPPNIITQVSSIATLGAQPTWLTHFQSILNTSASKPSTSNASSFLRTAASPAAKPIHNIIFPTAAEIRTSLDGYASGGSIHTKIQSAAQQKQLDYLRPLLCHWNHEVTLSSSSSSTKGRREAHRGHAAPHIKTYIRFNAEQTMIDWALVTSANMSKQAWGEVVNQKGDVWIQSWEAGVVVCPALFDTDAVMVPVFGRDMPQDKDLIETEMTNRKTVVGFRMPYDLPLNSYGPDEMPWVASLANDEPDWMGKIWPGY